jgi:hypothetical protein
VVAQGLSRSVNKREGSCEKAMEEKEEGKGGRPCCPKKITAISPASHILERTAVTAVPPIVKNQVSSIQLFLSFLYSNSINTQPTCTLNAFILVLSMLSSDS